MSDLPPTDQAVIEKEFCEAILAKGGVSLLSETFQGVSEIAAWAHYPLGDIYDPSSGAQWYYHCHPAEEPTATNSEHGHFHCFLRPDGPDGPIHHLIAIGVTADGQIHRIFTVNQWVVGDDWLDATGSIALLPRFDVQMPRPNYLVNRWLTAVIAAYEPQIAALIRARDDRLGAHQPAEGTETLADRALEVTSEWFPPTL